ncbi:MAG: hypothetical protein ABSC76_02890 [Terracidiphilus sp.]
MPAWAIFLVVCVGFFAVEFALEEAGLAGVVAELPGDCPTTGDKINSIMKSSPANGSEAPRRTNLGKDEALISPL